MRLFAECFVVCFLLDRLTDMRVFSSSPPWFILFLFSFNSVNFICVEILSFFYVMIYLFAFGNNC